jgi:prophage regulatory protein
VSEPKPNRRILRRPQVLDRVGMSSNQVNYLEKKGCFPKRIKISPKCAGWLEHEIDAYIDQQTAISRGQSVAA